MTNLHLRLKEILTGLSNLREMITNCDILKSTINAFPKMTQWMFVIDSFISKDLEVCTLDEFFTTMELHDESQVVGLEIKGEELKNGNITLVAQRSQIGLIIR